MLKCYTSILVVVDWFSNGCRFIPFCSRPSALQVAEVLLQHMCHCFGLLEDILSDRGPQFVESLLQEVGGPLAITVMLNTQPKINLRFLRAHSHSWQHEWAEFLVWAEYLLRCSATGLTPFKCAFGGSLCSVPGMSLPLTSLQWTSGLQGQSGFVKQHMQDIS